MKIFIILIVLHFMPWSGRSALLREEVTAGVVNEVGIPLIVNYNPDDYDANPMNWGAVRDDRGNLYVANLDGILEFDGVTWRLIKTPKGAWTLSLAKDSTGTIYAGLFGDFGYLAPDSSGDMQFISLLQKVEPAVRDFTEVWRIHCTRTGIYFWTRNKIFLLSDNKIKVIRSNTFFSLSAALEDTLYVEENGRGLMKIGSDSLILIGESEHLHPMHFLTLLPYDSQQMLVFTRKGLLLFDGRHFSSFESPVNSLLQKYTLSFATELPGRKYAISTYKSGVYIIDHKGSIIQFLNKSSGLRDQDVKSMYSDHQGTLWLLLNSGIAQVYVHDPFSFFTERRGIQGNVVSIVRHKKTIYAATSQAIYYLETAKNDSRSVPLKPDIRQPVFKQVSGISSQGFWLLTAGESLLAATGGEGVFRIDGDKAYRIESEQEGVFVLHNSEKDSTIVYAGLKNGLEILQYYNNNWTGTGRVKGINEEIRTIVEDNDGTLWLGTVFQGVLKVKIKSRDSNGWSAEVKRYNRSHGLPDGPVNISKIGGHIVFATYKGHRRFILAKNYFYPDSSISPELADTSRSAAWVEQDQFGQIFVWPINPEGKPELWVIRPRDKKIPVIDKSQFRSLTNFGTFHTTYTDNSRVIWIGCSTGLVRYDPSIQQNFFINYPTMIRRVSTIPEDSLLFGGAESTQLEPSVMPFEKNSLRFEYSVPFFKYSLQNRYQIYLEGYDENWSNWTDETRKDYTNLGYGNYRFMVRAKNIFNNTSQAAVYRFEIQAPWYLRWWAYTGYLLLIIAGVVVVSRSMQSQLIKRELKRMKLREAEIINQKNNELQDKNNQLEEILSKLQQAQNSLIESESRFRSVAESANDAIVTADQTGNITFWNKMAGTIFGYSKNEIIGKPLTTLMPEQYRDKHLKGLKRFFKTGQSRIMGRVVDLEAVTNSGKEFPIELTLANWETHNEKFVTGIIRDVTLRKQKEETLQNTQMQLFQSEKLSTLGKLSAGIAHELNNPAGSAKRSSAQLQKVFFDLQKANLEIGKIQFSDKQRVVLMDLERLAKTYSEKQTGLDASSRIDREQEIERWLETQNIEDAWELAPSLLSLEYDARKLTGLADKFQLPQLSIVINWLSATYTIYSLLVEISVGADRIAEIVGAFKTYTYMDQAPVQKVNVQRDLENTLILFQSRIKKGIKVIRDYDDNLPSIEAYGGELNQVWTNLIDNAIDAMGDEGKLGLQIRREESRVVVEISDDGPGIPKRNQSKIFDPFFTTKKIGSGTGLGLNISHNIVVQKHNGQMSFSSKPGETSFTVQLPIRLEQQKSRK